MKNSETEIESLKNKHCYSVEDLRSIMRLLRSEGGCPWDREQDHKSIRNNFIEETYEVIEAIDTENRELLREELGDVLLQVVFHARIEEEVGGFDLDDVADGICKKLIMRHPHIFGDVTASTSGEVLQNWDMIKNKEKNRGSTADIMKSVPPMLPALMRAQKIGKRAAKVGFDFPSAEQAMKKVYEEIDEVTSASAEDVEQELGDLLFAVVNVARLYGADSENALASATNKFISRFAIAEEKAASEGKNFGEMSLSEMDKYWDFAKSVQKNK